MDNTKLIGVLKSDSDSDDFMLAKSELERWNNYNKSEFSNFTFIPSYPDKNPVFAPLDILVDTEGDYKRNNHPLWIYFRNGYSQESEWIPLITEPNKIYIPLEQINLEVTQIHFSGLVEFVEACYQQLKDLADGKLDYTDFSIKVRNLMFFRKHKETINDTEQH